MTKIRFSPTQVASCGLPARGAYVGYDDQLRLDTYSGWLDKLTHYETAIDRLIALADRLVYSQAIH